jgi:putative inorganic carbon (hco3(-)) transporter
MRSKNKFLKISINYFAVLLAGIIFGLLLINISNFDDKWLQALAAVTVLSTFIAIKNISPKILLSLFTLLIVFNIDIFLFNKYFKTISEDHGVPGLQIAAFHVLLGFLYIRWVVIKHPAPRFNSSIVLLLILFILACISSLTSFYRLASMLETYRIFMIVAIAFYCYSNIRDKSTIVLITNILLATIPIETMLAVFQYFGFFSSSASILGNIGSSTQEMGLAEIIRPTGSFIHPGKFAVYLVLVTPITICAVVTANTLIRRLVSICIMLMAFSALLISFARAAWIGISFGLLLFFPLIWRVPSYRKPIFKIYASLALLAAVATPLIIMPRLLESDMGSAESRIPMATAAIDLIKAYPFFGVGPNNYSLESWRYAPTDLDKTMVAWPVHNFYLLIAAEIGLIALVFFLFYVFNVLRCGIKTNFSSDSEILSIKYGMTAGVFGFLITNSFNGHYMGEEVLFFFLSQLIFVCDSLKPALPNKAF